MLRRSPSSPALPADRRRDDGYHEDVTNDRRHRDDERALMTALFRYGVIAELVEIAPEALVRGDVARMVAEAAARTWHQPGVGPVTVSARSVYAWRAAYCAGGLDALCPKRRSDTGLIRAVPAAVLARAEQLRKENPKRATSTLLDIMRLEGTLTDDVAFHRATLDRHLDRRGASRRQMKVLGANRTIKMKFERFGQLWVGDYHHGPIVLGPDGKPAKAKLGAFIDHCTRWPVAHRYYLAENIASLRDCLLRALLTWGRPETIYVDRGAVYRAELLAFSLHRIRTQLIHSRAYYSKGRAVLERWWQLAGAFESEVEVRSGLLTIHQLNRLWEAYCDRRYAREVHSELGRAPIDVIADVTPNPLEPDVARELFRVKAKRTVHREDGCVAVLGTRFLCESWLRRRRVEVRFDPNDLSFVTIWLDGRRIQRAFPQPINAPPEPPVDVERLEQSVDYLALLRDDFDRTLLEHARPLAYADLEPDVDFGREDFVRVVGELAGLRVRPADTTELSRFWDTFGPLPEALVRIGVEHAIRLHGRGRHRRLYLHAVRTLVLAHLQNPTDEEETT